jgi:hypothetical protein
VLAGQQARETKRFVAQRVLDRLLSVALTTKIRSTSPGWNPADPRVALPTELRTALRADAYVACRGKRVGRLSLQS